MQALSLKTFLKIWPITFIALFLLNFIAHGLILSQFNGKYLSEVRKPVSELDMTPMIINYLVLSAAMSYLIPFVSKGKSSEWVAVFGFIVGGVLFLNLGLGNMFLLKSWPIFLVITDTLANALVFAALSLLICLLNKRFSKT